MSEEGNSGDSGSSGDGEAPDLGQFGSNETFKGSDSPDNTQSDDSSDE
ncbi:hypothetical protein Halar_0703 (plasmid) [halophilic archaeon DL31]|jgi:hypothetical protein|nr:hypothetical protein Halar_0703 [halophilic archaeon DL31]